MPTLEINGKRVQVGDEFLRLSPDQQHAAVDEIAGSMSNAPDMNDVGKSIAGGALTGTAAIPGSIGDVPRMLKRGAAIAFGQTVGRVDNLIRHGTLDAIPADQVEAYSLAMEKKLKDAGLPLVPKPWEVINTQKVLNAVEPITGKPHVPTTRSGRYASTIASMGPAAIAGGGTLPQRILQTVVPGAASEAAGELTAGTPYEPYARGGAAIMGSGVASVATRSGVPERMAGIAMGKLDDTALVAAAKLMEEARVQGIDLSWPEAVQHVTNGATRLGELQRVVENSDGGGAIMRDFYADRPGQVDRAAQSQFDNIAPNPVTPERLGPRVQEAAQGHLDNVNSAINTQTRPLYQAAESQILPNTPTNQAMLRHPAYVNAVKSIRADPVLGPQLAHLPDNSVGMIDAAQKVMRSEAEGLRVPGQGMNTYKSSLISEARANNVRAAKAQSPEYDAAVTQQAQLRDQHLNPLQEGPTGRLAATSDVGRQTQGVFPAAPQAGSQGGVGRALKGISKRDPDAAESLVRQHLETKFAEATQRLQSGPNQAGGAKFASIIAGNPQQRANLATALHNIPGGNLMWRGFERFLNVLEATGRRPAQNSATAFNQQITRELQRGGVTGETAVIAASPGKALTFIGDAYKRFRLGKGTADLAKLFTRGNLDDFRTILQAGPGSPKSIAALVRLLGQVEASVNAPPAPAN